MDFSIDIIVNGEKVGAVIGGQVLPVVPDEDKFRKTAQDLGINPEDYIKALRKVPIASESKIRDAKRSIWYCSQSDGQSGISSLF